VVIVDVKRANASEINVDAQTLNKMEIPKFKCKRCGHAWPPKISEPVCCPKCKSPYWNKERKVTDDGN